MQSRSHGGARCCCCFFQPKNPAQRTTLTLGLGLLFLSAVGVRCFAIGENSNRLRAHNNNHHHNLEFPPLILEKTQQGTFRSPTNLFHQWIHQDSEHDNNTDIPMDDADPTSSNIFLSTATNGTRIENTTDSHTTTTLGIWPCMDSLDKDLIKIALPVIGNYAINPLIGAVDLFWVNRMGNALAVAGQAAANQVFSSAFWFTSFLPSGTCNDKEKILSLCRLAQTMFSCT